MNFQWWWWWGSDDGDDDFLAEEMMDSKVRKSTQMHTAQSLQTQDVDPDSAQAVSPFTTYLFSFNWMAGDFA